MLVKITNREDPDQTASPDQSNLVKQSDLGLFCLFCPFWQVTRYFRTLTIVRNYQLTTYTLNHTQGAKKYSFHQPSKYC